MEVSGAKSKSAPTRGSHKVRLALVITELFPGGAERCLVELATRIDPERFAPVVYSLGPPPPQDRQSLVEQLRDAEIPVHFLELKSAWQYFGGVRRLAAMLRDQQAEIVQTFLFHANVLGARAARAASVPHLVTNIRVADPRRWRASLERWATRTADRIVCVSDGVIDRAGGWGFPSEKLVVIPNGIDVDQWRDVPPPDLSKFGVPGGSRVFVYVGRLDEQKGLDRFFAQLPRIFRELPQHHFLLVGEGKLRRQLEHLSRDLNIAQRVHFAGWQRETAGILAAADLLVLPSRWEGMPNVILEAMAAGKAVVASRVEGVADLLGSRIEAQSAAVGDWEGLATRITALLANSAQRKELGDQNQARARELFSLQSMVGQYEGLYLSLVGT